MKITNNNNLPQVLVDVVSDTLYKSTYKSYGVTTLTGKGVSETILSRRHWDELEEDVEDNVWALYGNAFHEYIKNHDKTEYSEKRLEYQVGSSKVVGVIDLYDELNHKIVDYKTCSVYKVKKQDYDDWKKQTLAYCWLLKTCENIKCNSARIIAILKDYSNAEAKRDTSYPQKPITTVEFTFTDEEIDNMGKYLIEKVELLDTKYKYTTDDKLPECDIEYRWHSADTWRVFKEGNKLATKTCWKDYEANECLHQLQAEHPNNKYYIEFTAGVDKKCEEYCKVAKFCPFYKATHKDTL